MSIPSENTQKRGSSRCVPRTLLGQRILIVMDGACKPCSLKATLLEHGVLGFPVIGMRQALSELRSNDYDAVIAHPTLREGTPLDLYKRVREQDPAIPFLITPLDALVAMSNPGCALSSKKPGSESLLTALCELLPFSRSRTA